MFLLIARFSGATFGVTFTVTKTADTNDNVCDADCSLREAIASANAFFGRLTSQGYNIIGNTSSATIIGNTTGNQLNVNPRLDPVLRDNGGNTKTFALRVGSPAIDKGDPNNFSATDQRGLSRPVDGDGNGVALPDIGAFEKQANDITRTATPFDFDNDGKADLSVFRLSNGVWYLQRSTQNFTGVSFGLSSDKLVPADYDGDGKTDVAVFRDGTWYLQRSQAGFIGVAFGTVTDKPIPNAFVLKLFEH